MSKRGVEVLGMLAVAAVLVPGLTHAGEVQVGGQGGTGSPPDDLCDQQGEECNVEIDWNPDTNCPGYSDLNALLVCLSGGPPEPGPPPASPPPPPEFEVDIRDGGPWGISVRRYIWWDYPNTIEIGRLRIAENVPGIATTQVWVEDAQRVVRIMEITEGPDPVYTGTLTIEIDDDVTEIEAEGVVDQTLWRREFDLSEPQYLSATDINVAILTWLYYESDFDEVYYENGSFVVSMEGGFRRVLVHSSDSSVVSSDIGLLPKNDPLVMHLFQTGGPF